MAENAEAIFAQATKLAPLLCRAEQVMQKHQESKGGLSSQSGTQLGLFSHLPHGMGRQPLQASVLLQSRLGIPAGTLLIHIQ